jgi:hypothetical protein
MTLSTSKHSAITLSRVVAAPNRVQAPKHFDVEREAEFESAASTMAPSRSSS